MISTLREDGASSSRIGEICVALAQSGATTRARRLLVDETHTSDRQYSCHQVGPKTSLVL